MVKTNRQAISEVIGDLKALSIDDYVSPKFIYNKLQGFTSLFVKRESEARRLHQSPYIWTPIPCFPMEKIPLTDCCDVDARYCKKLTKSVYKVPKVYISTFGKPFINISSLSYTKFFDPTTPKQYNNIAKREIKDLTRGYYWIENDYLYIPDSDVEMIRLSGFFIDPLEIKKFDYCNGKPSKNECISLMDMPFNCPDYLWEVVRQETSKDLFNFFKRSVIDNNPDMNEQNKT